MKVLISGGCGFLGSYLCHLFELKGYEVLAYDIDTDHAHEQFEGYDVRVINGDVRDSVRIDDTIREFDADIVVHLAARAVASYCDKHAFDAMDVNIGGLYKTLCALNNTKRFVFISSSFVYGNFKYVPVDENHTLNPMGVYGGCKVAAEVLVKSYCERFGIDWVIIRPSAVYGKGDRNRRVVQILLDNAIHNKPLVIEGADQLIDFTYITDTVQGIFLAATKSEASKQTYNITRGQGRSLGELAQVIKSLVPSVDIIEKPHDKNRPVRGALDISKARKELGYEPQVSLEDGVRKYYNWMVLQ